MSCGQRKRLEEQVPVLNSSFSGISADFRVNYRSLYLYVVQIIGLLINNQILWIAFDLRTSFKSIGDMTIDI